jgi:hypothetical protein
MMSKYAPLGDYLRKQRRALVPMTFAQIEQIIGAKLPKSQGYPAWWSNNPWNNVMTQIWLDAGFETEQVDVTGRKLVFRKVRETAPSDDGGAPVDDADSPTHHALIGWLKGTVQLAPDVDLTEPADPEWGEHVLVDRPWKDQK